eukprot:527647_1
MVKSSIKFYFTLSSSCYTRIWKLYINITNSIELNTTKNLIVNIMDDRKILCTICDGDCIVCNHDNFEIYFDSIDINATTFRIFFKTDMLDVQINKPYHYITYVPSKSNGSTIIVNHNYWYFLFFICIIPVGAMVIIWHCHSRIRDSFVVDKALVLIVGISEFDQQASLPGVKLNVDNLKRLWNKYNYDVYVCNETTLYSTKQNIMDFIDKWKHKLQDDNYQSVIFHGISHGEEGYILSSDGKEVELEFIRHEIATEAEFLKYSPIIKMLFHHCCQGTNDYSNNVVKKQNKRGLFDGYNTISTNDNYYNNDCHDSSYLIISGNIPERTLSDSGQFTNCICDSFERNVKRATIFKSDLSTLLIEIRQNLEQISNNAEIVNVVNNVCYSPVIYVKGNIIIEQEYKQVACDVSDEDV